MPLVVPGLQSKDGSSSSSTDDWMSKLAGKKLGDEHNETTFAKTDLPEVHRIIKPDSMVTKDHRPERLNVHVDEDGTVKHVAHG